MVSLKYLLAPPPTTSGSAPSLPEGWVVARPKSVIEPLSSVARGLGATVLPRSWDFTCPLGVLEEWLGPLGFPTIYRDTTRRRSRTPSPQ
jgi:hypothetical protein